MAAAVVILGAVSTFGVLVDTLRLTFFAMNKLLDVDFLAVSFKNCCNYDTLVIDQVRVAGD